MQNGHEWLRWKRWLGMAGKVASTQFLVQVLNAVTGFFIVRTLVKTDYAWFTIINTVAAMLATIGDSGLSSGLLSVGGKVWQDRSRFSSLIASALKLRLVIVGIAALGTVPWAYWMLSKNEASSGMAVLLLVVSLAGSLPAAETMVLSIAPRLRSEVHVQQMSDMLGAAVRLVLSATALLIFPGSVLLVLVVAVSQWTQFFYLRSRLRGVLDLQAEPSTEFRAGLLKVVRSLWFPVLFSCFQSQIGTFILSLSGKTASVAEFGALSRFGVAFSIVVSLIHHLVAPAFARSQSRAALGGLMLRSSLLLAGFCVVLTSVAWFFPHPLLWIIGAGYSGLERELVLLFVFQGMGTLVNFSWALNSARGWIGMTWLIPPATIVFQAVLFQMIDISTLSGTLWFMILSQIPPFALVILMAWRGFKSWHPAAPVSA